MSEEPPSPPPFNDEKAVLSALGAQPTHDNAFVETLIKLKAPLSKPSRLERYGNTITTVSSARTAALDLAEMMVATKNRQIRAEGGKLFKGV